MVSREENELLTRVGRGTPMGELMRRYWMPALLSDDMAEPDTAPQRVRLLGEDLVAFRDSQGRVGILDELCPHRLASLFLGRNEENGLRCVYHGWKFDVSGACVDMPNEPAESNFKERVRQPAYPVVEAGGVIWVYMGPREHQPAAPDFEWTRAPATYRHVSRTLEFCNYLQTIEGGIDTVHSSFLHNNDLSAKDGYRQIGQAPRLEVERTDYGFRYAGIRDVGDEGNYVRMYQFIMPFHQFRSGQHTGVRGGGRAAVPRNMGHMWVPIDDENTCVYNWMHAVDEEKPLTPEFILRSETSAGRGPNDERMIRTRTRANDWLIDREAQRTKTFTGISGLNTQDLAVQESMGHIVDRSKEHLGTTDLAVISMRQIMLDSVQRVREGLEPPGTTPDSYRLVRASDVVVPKAVRWQDAAAQELVARR